MNAANTNSRPVCGQEGLIRGAIVVFAIMAVFALVLLDFLSVYSAHRTLKEQANGAARAAVTSYVQSGSDVLAQQSAQQYLAERKAKMVAFRPADNLGSHSFVVTAERPADTYVFKYLAHLPGVGRWIERQLHPREASSLF